MKILETLKYKVPPVKGGYTDHILQVDLGTQSISTLKLSPDFKEKYIGGRGYALKLIWDGTKAETRYDSPENILVMASGPLGADPRFPGTGKFIVGTISPLTDTFVDSNVGGHFAPLLKLCGFDALAVSGISQEDVVLMVDGDEGTVQVAEAPIVWGGCGFWGTFLRKPTFGSVQQRRAEREYSRCDNRNRGLQYTIWDHK